MSEPHRGVPLSLAGRLLARLAVGRGARAARGARYRGRGDERGDLFYRPGAPRGLAASWRVARGRLENRIVAPAARRIGRRRRKGGARDSRRRELPQRRARARPSALADVRGVSAAYPLRGRVQIADALGASPRDASGTPQRGEVWAEPSLLARLNAPSATSSTSAPCIFGSRRPSSSDPTRVGGSSRSRRPCC